MTKDRYCPKCGKLKEKWLGHAYSQPYICSCDWDEAFSEEKKYSRKDMIEFAKFVSEYKIPEETLEGLLKQQEKLKKWMENVVTKKLWKKEK